MKLVSTIFISLFFFSSFSFSNGFPLAGLIASFSSALGYAAYSHIIHRRASKILELMQKVPSPEMIKEEIEKGVMTAHEAIDVEYLRKTVSKRSNLVLDMNDRKLWNEWISTISSDPSKHMISKEDIEALFGVEHKYRYRTYANFEEAGAYCKPFFTWKRFLLTFEKPTVILFLKPQKEEKKEGEETVIANVNLQDRFVIKTFGRMNITWYGDIVKDGTLYTIKWYSATIEQTFPFKKKVIIENPPICMKLQKEPWQIKKRDGEMICFQRGDVGYLVFDSK
ncbi:hypothetical protein CTEN210_12846 [Chaetoceros tenuissimus]|uniref:Uncharacterized protein n=1 Tax=Chaetoceros tenuissimus TaxID=426638 RepID=A0AAD3D459_9STRA|nr:hypothetical protein CTEN210_12846 [Chaetoceros tenuissimus]